MQKRQRFFLVQPSFNSKIMSVLASALCNPVSWKLKTRKLWIVTCATILQSCTLHFEYNVYGFGCEWSDWLRNQHSLWLQSTSDIIENLPTQKKMHAKGSIYQFTKWMEIFYFFHIVNLNLRALFPKSLNFHWIPFIYTPQIYNSKQRRTKRKSVRVDWLHREKMNEGNKIW